MIKKTSILAILFIFACALSSASIADDRGDHYGTEHQHMLLKFQGTGVGYFKYDVPGLEGIEVVCYDTRLVDNKINEEIGTATDCISGIQSFPDGDPDPKRFFVEFTSFFNLPGGTLVARSNVTVAEAATFDAGADPYLLTNDFWKELLITHTSGAATSEENIIAATGVYEGFTGIVRLSGLVNLSRFNNMNVESEEGTEMDFDCIFELWVYPDEKY